MTTSGDGAPEGFDLQAELQVEEGLRERILARDRYQCQVCGTTNNLHVHHILFRSQGGQDDESNMVTVCFTHHDAIHAHRLTIILRFVQGRWCAFAGKKRR